MSVPKTKWRRRPGPAGRLLSTSQLIQRSNFEMLVSCKQVSAIKTEPHFFTFSYFQISISHCRCCSSVEWLLSCPWVAPQNPVVCTLVSVNSQGNFFFVRFSDKCNLQNVFLFFLHYLFPKSLVNLIYLHQLSNDTTEADIGRNRQKYCSYHTTSLMFLWFLAIQSSLSQPWLMKSYPRHQQREIQLHLH